MKHLVHIQVTPQAGQAFGTRPGGPGAIVGRLVERFKPETVYLSPARQALFLVCDLSPADMAELMIAGCHFAGQHPDFIPVITGKDFGAMVGTVRPAAQKLIDG